jgi:hypothetical protein
MMSEADTQGLASWQAIQIVNHLRAMGWVFAAVVLWTRKEGGGLAGASYFDLPTADAGAMPRLADAVRTVANEMDRAHAAMPVPVPEWQGDSWTQTLGGTGVDAQAKRAAERSVLAAMEAVPDRMLSTFATEYSGELSAACRAEIDRRKVAKKRG